MASLTSAPPPNPTEQIYLKSLSDNSSTPIDQVIYFPTAKLYTSILKSNIRNLIFASDSTPRPLFIVAPTHLSHIQSTILCCKTHSLQLRIRSGGHDYDGLSYLHNYNSVAVDLDSQTAWVDSGATVGEVYHQIAAKSNYPAGTSPEILLERHPKREKFLKRKSDYVQEPISKAGLEEIWKKMIELRRPVMALNPYGGKMGEIGEGESPFPHRAGNLYKIQYSVTWSEEGEEVMNENVDGIRSLYEFMTEFVSSSPRCSYLNYRDVEIGVDLDIGTGRPGKDSYAEGKVYGEKYFGVNFERLVKVKTAVDPSNFFWNEQSIPVLPSNVLTPNQ
ncbi:Berberine bridge enzyme-like 8 [Linum grandiflorum]